MCQTNNEPGKRIDLTNCVFCPFRDDDVCMAYQQALDDKAKKPGYCQYLAVVVGPGIDKEKG
jgi:hypothetical protein